MAIGRLAVIGAGTMGHGIAQVFAQAGLLVSLTDSDPGVLAEAIPRIRTNLQTCLKPSPAMQDDAARVTGRITATPDLAEAVGEADCIVEAVLENLDIKHGVLHQLEGHCPAHSIIASCTSGYRVRDLAVALKRPDRFLAIHFWNPPYVIPVVEVMPGEDTAAQAIETTVRLLEKAGKVPVMVRRDVPGFIGNRLQHAMRREAIAMVAGGIADPADIDQVARLSFGLRMPVIGPLETIDLGGLELTQAIQSYLLSDLDRSTGPQQLVCDKVARGERGAKAGKGFYDWTPARVASAIHQRDEALLDLVNWLIERGLLAGEPHREATTLRPDGEERGERPE